MYASSGYASNPGYQGASGYGALQGGHGAAAWAGGYAPQPDQNLKYLRQMAHEFPNQQAVFTEIINLQAILNLPKGTEHFMSDVHGEYEAFSHILNNCSGVVRDNVNRIFGDELTHEEKGDLCTLIYYPEEKLALVCANHQDSPTWYKVQLDRLLRVARHLGSRYTRSKVRKAIPKDYSYIIDELLHTHPDENNYRVRYHERIIDSILETGSVNDFIGSLAELIKRLAVDELHLVGDIYDRGPGGDRIIDRLMRYHTVDVQWGNHDVLWMGAAAGSPACILNVLRNNLRYNNYAILENGYGISLRELVSFAERTYTADDAMEPLEKCVNVLLFKLEGQTIQRHACFDMTDRLLLDKMDLAAGTVALADGTTWPLKTVDFPTLDTSDPYALSAEEQHLVDKLVYEFTDAGRLHEHIDFLYTHGAMYKVYNGNVLFHGCVPMNADGTFSSMNCLGTWRSGRNYYDFCDAIARAAWRDHDQAALDWMWYLWTGPKSPACGRVMKTFERSFIDDPAAWAEPMDPYFTLTKENLACEAVLREFGVSTQTGHIVNGHTPVKTTEGEVPIRAGGKLLVIDGGFCNAYHKTTGIAGYTLISGSRGMRLKSHQAFQSIEEALTRNVDIESETNRFAPSERRLMVSDTDVGHEIREKINDLRQLLDAYRSGAIPEDGAGQDRIPR